MVGSDGKGGLGCEGGAGHSERMSEPDIPESDGVDVVDKKPLAALAVCSLVFGIIGLLTSFLFIGGVLGIVGAVCGVVHQRRFEKGGMAAMGTALSVVAMVVAVGMGGFVLWMVNRPEFRKMRDQMAGQGAWSEWIGKPMPNLVVKTLDGREFSLSAMRGRTVVVDFWATWCPPCVKEIPHFVALRSEVSEADLAMVGISGEEPVELEKFIKKNGINYPVASASTFEKPYSLVTGIPTTFFIDRNGILKDVAVGYHDLQTLRAKATGADWQGSQSLAPAGDRP